MFGLQATPDYFRFGSVDDFRTYTGLSVYILESWDTQTWGIARPIVYIMGSFQGHLGILNRHSIGLLDTANYT